ncbi:hypothetical protein AB0I51_42980 [Streptomyces sp. NPDC050549]
MTTHPDLSVPGTAYNPEQWPEEVWAQDRHLTRGAGADSVGILSRTLR